MTHSAVKSRQTHRSEKGGVFFRLLLLVLLVPVVCLLYLARHPLLRLAGSFWIVDEQPAVSDVIVVLGDDNFNAARAARAAELFRSGFAPRVVASGRLLRPYASVAELEQHDLTDRGVPAASVVRLTHSAEDTREEAVAISRELSLHGWKRVLVVTSNYHTRRSRYICERLFPAGTILRVIAARDSDYNPDDWWNSRLGLKTFLHEAVGMPVAMWELRHQSVQTSGPDLGEWIRRRISILIPMSYGNRCRVVYSGQRLYYSAPTV